MMFTAFILFSILPTLAAESSKYTCSPWKSDFENACIQEYEGTPDGGRCFFVGGVCGNWSQCWDVCAKKDAKLAQIHTGSEYRKVVEYLRKYYGNTNILYARYALYDANYSTHGNEPAIQLELNTTVWYDDVEEANPALIARNTWIRVHTPDDWASNPAVAAPRCLHLFKACNFYDCVSDDPCTSPAFALCQVTTLSQNYTLTNYCLTETPIEELMSTTDPQYCAESCSRRAWCRSFNYVIDDQECDDKCQLFTWSVYDDCQYCASRTNGTSGCYHYNYES